MATATMTIEQFLGMEDTEPSSEYACGEVFQKPMPNRSHAAIQLFLSAILFPFLERTGIGEAFTELRCIFGPPGRTRIYVPDLCFVTCERLDFDQFLMAAPDLAVEVLSPDQHMPQFLAKIQFYLLYGVRLVWVIDPSTKRITVQAPGVEPIVLGPGDTLDGSDLLPGFTVPVDDIFARARG